MARPSLGKAAVASLVVLPFAMLVVYGALGIFWSTTVWEVQMASAGDAAAPVVLRPGAVYRLVLTTECFVGPDYRVHLAAYSEETGNIAANAKGNLSLTRHVCRSLFESREFAVGSPAKYTIEWNLSAGVFSHAPVLRLVVKMMTFFDGMDYISIGAVGGAFSYPLAIAFYRLLGKRPPRQPQSIPRAVTRSAPASA